MGIARGSIGKELKELYRIIINILMFTATPAVSKIVRIRLCNVDVNQWSVGYLTIYCFLITILFSH